VPACVAGPGPPGPPGAPPPAAGATYTVPARLGLAAHGPSLAQNDAPMGTMTLTGDPPAGWVRSPGPMALEAAALEACFGGLDAARDEQPGWWAAISASGLAMPTPLGGAIMRGHEAPLDVVIDTAGGGPTQVVLRTTLALAGGPAPRTHQQVVTPDVRGSVVTLGGWAPTPA
jgi:hypothetical protein